VPVESYFDEDEDTAMLRVYTDTLEGEPQTQTDVHETEETLPDGTVVRRRVTTTRQQQTIVKRVVMEGPEDELPTNEDEAEQILQQTSLADDDEVGHTQRPSKIDLQLCLPQRHCLRSRDDTIADQRHLLFLAILIVDY